MKSLNLLVVFLLMILVGCNNQPSDRLTAINVENEMNNLITVKLSDIGDKLTYIPLETSDNVLIGRYPKIVVTSDKILVSSNKQPLYVFDKMTGKYLNTIGHRGDDPEAYADDGWGNIQYWVDNKTNLIYFQSNNREQMLKYTIDGKLVGKIDLPTEADAIVDLHSSNLYIENDTIWIYNKFVNNRTIPFLICLSGKTGEIYWKRETMKDVLPSYDDIENVFYLYGNQIGFGGDQSTFVFKKNRMYSYVAAASSFCKINDKLILKEAFTDTLFQVGNNELTPYKILNMGAWGWQYDKRYERDASENRLHVDYLYGNDRKLLMHLTENLYEGRDKRKEYLLVHALDENKTMIAQSNYFVNDIDSTLDLSIWGISTNNEFYSCVSADDYLANTKQSVASLSQLVDDDNPVIVLIE